MDPGLKEKGKSKEAVSFWKLISYSSGGEKCQMFCGWAAAIFCGLVMPIWAVMLGSLFDASVAKTKEQMWLETKISCLVIVCSGFLTWTMAFTYFSILLIFAEKVSRRIRVAYLKAIFSQDSGWFDNIQQSQLSARL